MGFAIKQSRFPADILETVRTRLCLPIEGNHNRYNRGPPPEPIRFYKTEGDILHLPYLFASAFFQVIPNIDIPYHVTGLQFTGTLREKQIPVEQEAWEQLQRYGTSTLGLYPGFGKTILGAKLASRAKLITVVLVHRDVLAGQWKKTFQDVTNANVWIVGEKDPPPIADVIICMDTRWDQIPQAFRNNIGFLIIDEAHAFCTRSHVDCLLAFHPKYILLESASLERDDGMHAMAYAIAGNHGIYRESNMPFSVMKIITNTTPIRRKNRMGDIDYTALNNEIFTDPRRNQLIIDLVLANPGKKTLILTLSKDHSILLCETLIKLGISADFLCGSKKGYIDSQVLTGTVSKIGTGFDPATSCPTYAGHPFDLLILVCSLKKYSMLVQNVGRVFRADFPTVMVLVDNDDIFKSHFVKARRWYIARGGTITEYNIPNPHSNAPNPAHVQETQISWAQAKAQQLSNARNPQPTLNARNPQLGPIKLVIKK